MLNSKPEIIESLEKQYAYLKELQDDAILNMDFLEADRLKKAIGFNRMELNKFRNLLMPNLFRNQEIKRRIQTTEQLKENWKKQMAKYNHLKDPMPSDEYFETIKERNNRRYMEYINKMYPEKSDFQIDTQIFEDLIESLEMKEISAFILWLSEKRGEKIHFSMQEKILFVEITLGEKEINFIQIEKLGFFKTEKNTLLYNCSLELMNDETLLKQRISRLVFEVFEEIDIETYFEVY